MYHRQRIASSQNKEMTRIKQFRRVVQLALWPLESRHSCVAIRNLMTHRDLSHPHQSSSRSRTIKTILITFCSSLALIISCLVTFTSRSSQMSRLLIDTKAQLSTLERSPLSTRARISTAQLLQSHRARHLQRPRSMAARQSTTIRSALEDCTSQSSPRKVLRRDKWQPRCSHSKLPLRDHFNDAWVAVSMETKRALTRLQTLLLASQLMRSLPTSLRTITWKMRRWFQPSHKRTRALSLR